MVLATLIESFLVAALGGCATVGAVGIAAERASTEQEEVALGWDVERDESAHLVRWRECISATQCTTASHERASGELEGIDVLGTVTMEVTDGPSKTVEVKRLHFGPPPPNRPTLATEVRARMEEAAPEPAP